MAEKVERRLAAILSADVVGYSRLVAADEEGTIARLRALREELIDRKFNDHNGRIVKVMGDGVLVEFASVVDAVRCAAEIQREMAARNDAIDEDQRIVFRVGINLGDIVIEGDDIHGDGVNIAARLEQFAQPGGIIVSGTAFDQAKNKADIGFEDLGPQQVKNIPDPVRAYRVLLDPTAAGTVVAQAGGPKAKSQRTRWMIAGAVAAVAAIAIALGVLLTLEPWVERVEAADPDKMAYSLPDKPSLVVLPFENVGGNPENAYFSAGVTSDIIAHLSTWPELFIIDYHSSKAYLGKPVTVKQVAEELGVRYVLQGSVQHSGEKIRINIQLIDSLSGRNMWSERYDRLATDLFELQDEITRNIATEMSVNIMEGELARITRSRSGDNLEAWALGMQAWQTGGLFTKDAVAEAMELSEQAIEVGGEYVPFLVGLAWWNLHSVSFGWSEDPGASINKAIELANRALEVDDSYPELFGLLGHMAFSSGRLEEALEYAERAKAMAPNSSEGHFRLAVYLAYSGRPEEALEEANTAMRLSPHHPPYFMWALHEAYFGLENFEAALEAAEKWAELAPGSPFPYPIIAATQWKLGRVDEAKVTFGEMLKLRPGYSVIDYRRESPFPGNPVVENRLSILLELGLPEHPPLALPDKPSIAVLPFTNMSDDPEQEWFADGMTDDLITDLSKISGLFVIARNSSFTYKGQAVDVKTVGRELGVKHVLEGSVRRMGDQVRINAQLIDAATGGHLWAERYDGAAEDIFALQEEVLGKIVASLAITLTPKEKAQIERVPTGDLKAYEIYRHAETALAHLNHQTQNWTSPATEALSLYESAIARDPSFAAAYAGDAYVAYNVWRHDMWWVMLGSKSLARAKASAARALDLDPSNARAHGVLALIDLSDGDYDSAIARAREAVTSDPNAVESHVFLARILSWSGEHEKAFSAIETATRLDPKPKSWVEAIRGWVLFNARQYDRAVEPLEWVRNEVPTSYTNRVVLAATYAQLNRLEEANAEASKAIEIDQLSNVTLQVERQSAAAYRNSVDLEHWIDALRVAGVPEWPFGFEGRDEDRLTDEQLRALVFGGNTMRLRVWKNRKELWPNVAFMTIASDGHYRYRSRNNPDQEDWDFVFGGRSEVRDGMLCSASPEVRRGKFECARYYRNPNGTREERNEYISVHPNWVIYQSPE